MQRLVTAKEGINLSKFNTLELFDFLKEIEQEYKEQHPDYHNDILWSKMDMYSTVYTIGRLQGIREERAKHHTQGGV